MRIVLTGVPGTGKTTIAKKLAAQLGLELVDINQVVTEKKLWRNKDKFGTRIVDLRKLGASLKGLSKKNNWVVEGHLACEFKLPADLVIVLRTKPSKLEKRLAKRGYAKEKLEENLMAEMLDYCTIKSLENYPEKKVFEIETSGTQKKTISEIISITKKQKKSMKLRAGWVDWSEQLLKRL